MTANSAHDGELRLNFISPETRCSALIIQKIADGRRDAFIEWQRGITNFAKDFEGYERTDVFPPVPGEREEWYVMVHFRGHDALENWLNSSKRQEWLARRPTEIGDFTIQKIKGFDGWFPGRDVPSASPPGWKMALTVLLGLYPTVMLLSIGLARPLASLPMPVGMLLSNMASICILQWCVMPLLTKCFAKWLCPSSQTGAWATVTGASVMATMLAAWLTVFLLAT
ncbi:MAG: hypothetical protein U1D30_12530 [Planctomycetota bacterium]